ncbi:hypothetical protein D3C77_704950 [compost metagenome]
MFTYEDVQLSYIIKQELLKTSSRFDIVLSYVQPVWVKMEEILQQGKEEGVFHFDSLSNTSLMIKGICFSYNNYNKLQTQNHDNNDEDFESFKQFAKQFILNGLKVTTTEI